jgi:hypothetical protein
MRNLGHGFPTAHLARQALRAPLALRPVGLRGGLLATLPPLRVLGVLITLRLAAISPIRLPSAGPMPSRGFRGICSLPPVAPLFHGPHAAAQLRVVGAYRDQPKADEQIHRGRLTLQGKSGAAPASRARFMFTSRSHLGI